MKQPPIVPVDRKLLVALRHRQLRADEGARAWGGLRHEAELDVDKLVERKR